MAFLDPPKRCMQHSQDIHGTGNIPVSIFPEHYFEIFSAIS